MKINQLKVQNFVGIGNIDLETITPMQVFAGPNGAGKSSIQHAIRLALTGKPCRDVSKKKDYPLLVKNGSKKGLVEVAADSGTYIANLPKMDKAVGQESEILPVLLESNSFAAMKPVDRRQFLMKLMNVKPTKEVLVAMFKKYGLDDKLMAPIRPSLRAGFSAACDAAKNYARDCKADWKAITGEAWGADKGEDWKPELIQFDQELLASKQEQFEKISDQLDAENSREGQIDQLKKEAEAKAQRKQFLTDKANMVTRYKAAFEAAQKAIADQEKMLDKVKKNAGVATEDELMTCPCCGVVMYVVDGDLEQYQGETKDPNYESVVAHEKALESLKRTLANANKNLDEAKAAQYELDAIEDVNLDSEEYSTKMIQEKINGLKGMRDEIKAEVDDLKKTMEKVNALHEAEAKANACHILVIEYLKIAEALAPTGIPSELLQSALTPFNERLRASSDNTSWHQLKINCEFDIEYKGISYHMLSESEKWRSDAMICEAISHFSGMHFVMLDRFDVLDIESRSQLIYWLCDLVEAGDIESALLFGTLKSIPTGDDVCQFHWIDGGEIAEAKEVAA